MRLREALAPEALLDEEESETNLLWDYPILVQWKTQSQESLECEFTLSQRKAESTSDPDQEEGKTPYEWELTPFPISSWTVN